MPFAHGAILLAAGASRRLGQPKQLVEVGGETLLRRAACALLATAPLDCVVVLGHAPDDMRAALAGLPLRSVVAADYAEGMAASLRTGIAALDARCTGALIALTDQPALDAAHLRALRDAWAEEPQNAAASLYARTLGVPALLPRSWFDDVAAIRGDTGARELLRTRADVVAVAAPELARDVDVPADLHPAREDHR